jgi:diketogulonate reductase-like aldo/keto reductase
LRLNEGARPDQRFDDQLAAMVKAREEGLIGGIGLSGVTREHLSYAVGQTDIVWRTESAERRQVARSSLRLSSTVEVTAPKVPF